MYEKWFGKQLEASFPQATCHTAATPAASRTFLTLKQEHSPVDTKAQVLKCYPPRVYTDLVLSRVGTRTNQGQRAPFDTAWSTSTPGTASGPGQLSPRFGTLHVPHLALVALGFVVFLPPPLFSRPSNLKRVTSMAPAMKKSCRVSI